MVYPLESIRRGYKLPGVKLLPRDPYNTKAFAKWVAENQRSLKAPKAHGSSWKIEKLAQKGSKKRAARKIASYAFMSSLYDNDRWGY